METIIRQSVCMYRMQSLLGSGSFGSVYRCLRTDEATGTQTYVALKFMRTRDDIALRAECQILQEHSHESIVQVVEWLEADKMDYSSKTSQFKRRGSAIFLFFELEARYRLVELMYRRLKGMGSGETVAS